MTGSAEKWDRSDCMCAQGVNGGFHVLPVMRAKLCVQPRVCKDTCVECNWKRACVHLPITIPATCCHFPPTSVPLSSLPLPHELILVPAPSSAFLQASSGLGWEAWGAL